MNIIDLYCPICSFKVGNFSNGQLNSLESCQNCGFEIKNLNGVPCLRETCENLNYLKFSSSLPSYNSSDLDIPFINTALDSGLATLQIGGGIDLCSAENLIKSDAYLYSKDMDLICDAHCLPFKSESFSFVYALAVFEHLHSPWIAADEIFRVLKPGGRVFVLTAFMQHLHGYPNHYFNMTIPGLERIFSNFDIIETKPSKKTSFNQLSYIIMDFHNFVSELKPFSKYSKIINKSNDIKNEFCSLVDQVDADLLYQIDSFKNWAKIAPSLEITAIKK